MKSYKDIAYQILTNAGKPLHYRKITDIAIKEGLVKSVGKTPWATMNAQLSMDIAYHDENSMFLREGPGMYKLNPKWEKERNRYGVEVTRRSYSNGKMITTKKYLVQISEQLTTKQKGDIAEARVAELITLYGNEGLSCYRPVSDDEGIDLIVKRREKLEIVYVQVKSTYGWGARDRGFVSTVKEKNLQDKARNLLVFVYFDFTAGDLFDHAFCIPVPEFLKLSKGEKNNTGKRVFSVGLKSPDKSKYAEFMIEKRELANKILEIMDKL